MNFYVITVNGDVTTIAQLSDDQADGLRKVIADRWPQGGITPNVRMVKQEFVATDRFTVETQIESDVDSWAL